MNAPRGWHCMITTENTSSARLFVFGGCYLQNPITPLQQQQQQQQQPQPSSQLQLQTAQPVTLTEYYTPQTNQWTIVKPMINLHKEASCVNSIFNNSNSSSSSSSSSSFIYIFGGYNVQTKTSQKLVSQYDYSQDSWSTVGQLSHGMTGVGACVLDLPSTWHQSELDDKANLDLASNLSHFNFEDSSTSDNDHTNESLEWSTQTSLPSDEDQANKSMTCVVPMLRKNFKFRKSSLASIPTSKT